MPLVARPLFNNLGIDWGNTLLGCLTVVFIPIPYVSFSPPSSLSRSSLPAMHYTDTQIRSLSIWTLASI